MVPHGVRYMGPPRGHVGGNRWHLRLCSLKCCVRSIPKESLALAYCVQGRLAEAEEALRDEINAARINPQDIANQQLPKYQELFGLQLDLGPS
jgi:hypothetical protein